MLVIALMVSFYREKEGCILITVMLLFLAGNGADASSDGNSSLIYNKIFSQH